MSFDLQQHLLKSIPIASEMQLEVVRHDKTSLAIRAPIFPNRNDKGTAFAGSLYSAMVLSGWLFTSTKLRREEIDAQVVVVSADIQYLKPVDNDFIAVCRLSDEGAWDHFVAKLRKRKNYKISLLTTVEIEDTVKCRMSAEYIAWLSSLSPY